MKNDAVVKLKPRNEFRELALVAALMFLLIITMI
jgi:hypothetical protein